MNPLKKFRLYITGGALARTDDVFERARINLTYNFTLFFLVLGLVFYGNILANNYWWQFYITTFGVISLPVVLLVLRKTKNVRTAGYYFIGNQVIMSLLNGWLYHFELNIIGGFWIMVQIIFVFFVMGRMWGFFMTAFALVFVLAGTVNDVFDYYIPSDQVPEQQPVFVLVPFAICVYGIYQVVRTRDEAETQINLQKQQLELVNREISTQKQEIISSISYAQRIQTAVLPHDEHISRFFPLSFILYKPKDIVSGDFYWFHEIDKDRSVLVCADCTGHGVPGAFMTVICGSLLNQTVADNKIYQPSAILTEVDKLLNVTLKQNSERFTNVQDGMDLTLMYTDKSKAEIILCSARRPVIFIRDDQMQEIKGSRFSLGGMRSGEKKFDELKMNYRKDDVLFMFTDGYHDQFGGEKGKKYSTRKLKDFLFSIHQNDSSKQMELLNSEIEGWKGKLEQVDDICVIGIRF